MKLTVDDIDAIKVGEEKTFKLKDAKAVLSACVLVTYTRQTKNRSFETKRDMKKFTLTIMAI